MPKGSSFKSRAHFGGKPDHSSPPCNECITLVSCSFGVKRRRASMPSPRRGHDAPALATLSNEAILGHLPTVGEDGTGAQGCSAGRNGEREVERAGTVDGDGAR